MGSELLYRKVHKELKQQIFEGKCANGDLLPSENELCETYKITRTFINVDSMNNTIQVLVT